MNLENVQHKIILQDMNDCSETFQEEIQALYDLVNVIYHLLNLSYIENCHPIEDTDDTFKLRQLGWDLQNSETIIDLKRACLCFIKQYEHLDAFSLGDLVSTTLKIAKKSELENAEKLYYAADKLYSELMERNLEPAGEDHIHICRILGDWLLSQGNEAKDSGQFDLADQFYIRAMSYENKDAFLYRAELYLNQDNPFFEQGITLLREWDILCLKRDFICEPAKINLSFDQACQYYQEHAFAECEEELNDLCSYLEEDDPLMGAVNYNMAVLNLRDLADDDDDIAVTYLKTAANQNIEKAALLLAVLYYEGMDCSLTDEEAYAYLLRGYALNHGIAGFYRSKCVKEGRGTEQIEEKVQAYSRISDDYYLMKFKKGIWH